MNLDTFINEVSFFHGSFELDEQKRIRNRASGLCPLCHVNMVKTGTAVKNEYVMRAAGEIGIGEHHAAMIADAADNRFLNEDMFRYEVLEIRNRTLRALGLRD
jgi:hypothetical protein